MARSVDYERKRNHKIARTLVRLKHSLRADDELEEFFAAEKEALLNGEVLQLEVDLTELNQ